MKNWILLWIVFLASHLLVNAQPLKMPHFADIDPQLIARYDQLKQPGIGWCDRDERAVIMRQSLRQTLLVAAFEGIESGSAQAAQLASGEKDIQAGVDSRLWERRYEESALSLAWKYFRGADAEQRLAYDGVSGRYLSNDRQSIASGLAGVHTAADLQTWLSQLLPVSEEYRTLKDSLALYLKTQPDKAARIAHLMNNYRWVHHFSFGQLIIINIPSAGLRYYESDTLRLRMKVVLGQPSKRTPRFAGWCDQLVLYPYWNVPHRIAVNEFLPLLKKHPPIAAFMDFQIIDDRGKLVDPAAIAWTRYNTRNFPYKIRQVPGCSNALGVLKFNLTDPFNVYMHDTNLKSIFQKNYRYYSHGCIRLEKPFELGLALTHGSLDTTVLTACFKDRQPAQLPLSSPIPVFVLYNTVGIDSDGKLIWYRDIYGLGL